MEIVLDPIKKRIPDVSHPAVDKSTAHPQAESPVPVRKKRSGVHAAAGVLGGLLCFALAVLFIITRKWSEPIKEYPTDNPYITSVGVTLVSAHRSGGGIFPENTMLAFQNCVNAETFRTDIFEFDLHITKDGELILLHDDTLDRTTDAADVFGVAGARPEDYTLEQLGMLNFGAKFTDAEGNRPYVTVPGGKANESLRVATLSQVLDYLEENGGFRYIIEIKNKNDLGYRAADRLYEILKERGLLSKAVVGTFNGEVTKYMDDHYPDMLRSAGIREVVFFYLDSLLKRNRPEGYYKFTALQIPANQFLIKLGTPRLVNYAHKNNIAVQYWTINDAETMQMLKSINADCVMSDVPDIAYKMLHGKD